MKDKAKSPEIVQDLCKRLRSQFEDLHLDADATATPEGQARHLKERAEALRRRLVMELVKRQLGELD